MCLPLILVGFLLLVLAGLLPVCVAGAQQLHLALPLLGDVTVAAESALLFVWSISALAAGMVVFDVMRNSRWFPPDRTGSSPPAGIRLARLLRCSLGGRLSPFLARFGRGAGLRPLLGTPAREIVLTALLLLGALRAVALQQIELPRALLLVAFLGAAVAVAMRAVELLDHEPVELRSNWGGLGGALGGWRLSQPAVLLVLAMVFVGASVATVATIPPTSDAVAASSALAGKP